MDMTFEVGRGRAAPSVKTHDRFEVVPAGGDEEWQTRYNKVLALLQALGAAKRAVRIRDDRGGMMLIKRGAASIRNDLDRLDMAIVQLSTPSVGQVAQKWHADYATREVRLCAEAKAAYDARNPHKKRGSNGAYLSEGGNRHEGIDFDNGTMLVCNTVVKFKFLIEHEQTKSAKSKRTLVLIDDTIPYLKGLKAAQDAHKAKCINHDPDPQGHVCTNSKGNPFTPDYVSRAFNSLLKRHSLPHIRFHELRHTAGSLLLNSGMSVKQIAEYLGHEKVSTTLDIYTHIDFEGKKAAAQTM